ncbi:hypothetical protein RJ639_025519 [Escallonia herrerae]|uniref:Uncharacterized protein n=1 Tax=Escallonia herrerae TaxID=1293975 RepID=A0AA88S5W5_9ASTE|nr:hypothetical protein RJ639_025519 [Escallonia herrerae]
MFVEGGVIVTAGEITVAGIDVVAAASDITAGITGTGDDVRNESTYNHMGGWKRKAAESLEKLLNVTREELPGTMAAVRLSGMEISDLTMELSDLGREITKGVRSSTRAVRLAEERLRRLTNMAPSALTQEVILMETKIAKPALARSARGIKEGIVKGRAVVQMFFTLTRFSKMFLNYFKARAKV